MGPRRALAVGLLDVAKGAVPVLIAIWAGATPVVGALTGVAAVFGAWKSVFLHFHGGRGVAAGVGGMAAVSIGVVLISLPVFLGIIYVTRYVSLGSLLGTAFGALVSVVFVALGLAGRGLVAVQRRRHGHRLGRSLGQHRASSGRHRATPGHARQLMAT